MGLFVVMGVWVVWLVWARPPRAYPARIAALARAPFTLRKGRLVDGAALAWFWVGFVLRWSVVEVGGWRGFRVDWVGVDGRPLGLPLLGDELDMRFKVTVVGAGNVGATTAQRIFERGYADVVLVDVVEDMPQGKALDLLESGPVLGTDAQIVGSNDYGPTAGSDVVVITAGIARRPGMSRDDLLLTNMRIVQSVTEQVVEYSPDCIIVVVSNPLDAMVQLAQRVSGFPKERVVGMAGILDTARFRTFLAQELNVSVTNVQAYVLGGHGDTMVPLIKATTVGGVPVSDLIGAERLEEIVQRTRDGGAEIVALLKTGSAYYAPSAASAQMVEAILLDRKEILPCAAMLEGEYGISGLYVGVPVKLGAGGVEEVVEVELTEGEESALRASADAVRELVGVMGGF